MTTPPLTISARQSSRWRCGVEHRAQAVRYEAGHWTPEQLAALRADPQLVVVELDDAAPPAPGGAPERGLRARALDGCRALAAGRDPASWTASGKPQVSVLEALLECDVSAADRDAWWADSSRPDGAGTD